MTPLLIELITLKIGLTIPLTASSKAVKAFEITNIEIRSAGACRHVFQANHQSRMLFLPELTKVRFASIELLLAYWSRLPQILYPAGLGVLPQYSASVYLKTKHIKYSHLHCLSSSHHLFHGWRVRMSPKLSDISNMVCIITQLFTLIRIMLFTNSNEASKSTNVALGNLPRQPNMRRTIYTIYNLPLR